MQDKHVFIGQRMNLDDDGRLLKENETRETYNLRSGNTSTNGKGCLETLKSNLDINTLDINIGYTGIPATVYYNTSQSQTFIRNNCGSGYSGSTVTYTVDANIYYSTISQLDADNQALADITANGQNLANSTGTCTLIVNGTLFSSFSNIDGSPGGYLKVSKNGTLITDIERFTDTDSFSVSNGDVIHIECSSNNPPHAGNSVELRIYSSVTGLRYSTTLSGYNEVITYDYTYASADGSITIECNVPIS